MSDDLQQLEDWAAPLLRCLQPAERARLSRTIGTSLRRSQQRRIAAQKNPDGSAFTPRKPPSEKRAKAGRIKRKAMFAKIRQAKHLRVRSSAKDVSVGFMSRVSRIARVHQEGLSDTVTRGGPRVTYERRRLLGFSPADVEQVRDLIIDHLRGQ